MGEKSGTTSTFGASITGRMEAGGVISLRWEMMGGGAGLRGTSAQGLGPEFEMTVGPRSRDGEVELEKCQDGELNVGQPREDVSSPQEEAPRARVQGEVRKSLLETSSCPKGEQSRARFFLS